MIINFVGPAGKVTRNYSVLSNYTPAARVSTSLNVAAGRNTITFVANNNVTATITAISLVSTLSSTNTIPVLSWTNGTGTSATFTATLASGSYKLLVLTTPYGYVSIDDTINVSVPPDANMARQTMSFNGGNVTITGSNLSPSSYITINGFRGNISSYGNSSVIYNVPPFVTAVTQSEFNLQTVSLLDNTKFGFFSDQDISVSNVSAAFDNLINTMYGSPNSQCWIGVDAG